MGSNHLQRKFVEIHRDKTFFCYTLLFTSRGPLQKELWLKFGKLIIIKTRKKNFACDKGLDRISGIRLIPDISVYAKWCQHEYSIDLYRIKGRPIDIRRVERILDRLVSHPTPKERVSATTLRNQKLLL